MLKFIKTLFKNLFFLKRIRDLENAKLVRDVELNAFRLLLSSQTQVIAHIIKAYQDLYDTVSTIPVIEIVDTAKAESEIDTMYTNFLIKIPVDDDLLN